MPWTNRILHIGFRNSSGRQYPANAINLGFYTDDLNHKLAPTDVTQWHHYAMTYDARTKKQSTIIDGDIKNSVTRVAQQHFLGGGTNPFTIGHRYGNEFYFDGLLDELWVFDTVLTNKQILNLYRFNNINGKKVDIPETNIYALIVGLSTLAACMLSRRVR